MIKLNAMISKALVLLNNKESIIGEMPKAIEILEECRQYIATKMIDLVRMEEFANEVLKDKLSDIKLISWNEIKIGDPLCCCVCNEIINGRYINAPICQTCIDIKGVKTPFIPIKGYVEGKLQCGMKLLDTPIIFHLNKSQLDIISKVKMVMHDSLEYLKALKDVGL